MDKILVIILQYSIAQFIVGGIFFFLLRAVFRQKTKFKKFILNYFFAGMISFVLLSVLIFLSQALDGSIAFYARIVFVVVAVLSVPAAMLRLVKSEDGVRLSFAQIFGAWFLSYAVIAVAIGAIGIISDYGRLDMIAFIFVVLLPAISFFTHVRQRRANKYMSAAIVTSIAYVLFALAREGWHSDLVSVYAFCAIIFTVAGFVAFKLLKPNQVRV